MERSDAGFRTFRDFYRAVDDQFPMLLPRALRGFTVARLGRVYKVWYERPRHHYELWFRDGGLEVAYHLEGPPEADESAARLLRQRLRSLRRSLGGDVTLEPFGPGWSHLFELWPGVTPRTPGLATDAADRLGEYVRALEPVLRR
jgi:hypothetical protein